MVVGHNVDNFDLSFIRAECRRAGGGDLVPGPVPTVDTLAVAQAHLGLQGRARLVDCCNHFGLSWDDHHSALGDARVTAALFRSMRAQLGDGPLGIPGLLARAARSTGRARRGPCPSSRAGPSRWPAERAGGSVGRAPGSAVQSDDAPPTSGT